MDALEELVARDSIRQLAERYALAVDAKDIDTVALLFAADVDNGRYGPGREGVKNFYDQALRKFHCSMHLVANHVIDFDDGDHAHGVVYCRAQHHVVDPDDYWFDMALAYFDDYERVGGQWVFRRRKLRSWYRQDVGHPEHDMARVVQEPPESGPQRGSRMPEAFPTFDTFWGVEPRPLPARPS